VPHRAVTRKGVVEYRDFSELSTRRKTIGEKEGQTVEMRATILVYRSRDDLIEKFGGLSGELAVSNLFRENVNVIDIYTIDENSD
jgi:hypothetical protein